MANRGLPEIEKMLGQYLGGQGGGGQSGAGLPQLPAMASQTMQGGMGSMGATMPGHGYQKARRFAPEPDFKAFLRKYAGVDDKNESTIEPRELLNL